MWPIPSQRCDWSLLPRCLPVSNSARAAAGKSSSLLTQWYFYGALEVKPFDDLFSVGQLPPCEECCELSTGGQRVACYDHDAGRRWTTRTEKMPD